MKRLLTTTALIAAMAVSTQAHALFGLFGDDCTAQAASLVQSHGPKVTSLFAKVQAVGVGAVSAADLSVSEGEFAAFSEYVDSGCAKEHLTKALELAAESVKSGAAAGAVKGLF